MNKVRAAAVCSAGLLLCVVHARAVTYTWDGNFGVNPNDPFTSSPPNWTNNTPPVSNLATTDVIFAGPFKVQAIVDAALSMKSITFDNNAGPFSFAGAAFSVGTGGIVNNVAPTMFFQNQVDFSGVANSTINGASGGFIFGNQVVLPSTTLTVAGSSPTTFVNFAGSSHLQKQGTGTMSWSPHNQTVGFDITIDGGTFQTGGDGSTDVFTSASAVAVNGTSVLSFNENTTLDGAQLTRASGADLNLGAGKTLLIKNSADAIITGHFTHDTTGTITVDGTGSTLSTTASANIRGGGTLSIVGGADVTVGTSLSIATFTTGTLTVDGVGSSVTAGTLGMTQLGGTATVTFSNGSSGSFNFMGLHDLSPSPSGGTGTFSVLSGADVTTAQYQQSPSIEGASVSTLISGAGSTLTVTGTGSFQLGTISTPTTALFEIKDSGTVTTGTGDVTVLNHGTLAIAGGNLNCNGKLIVRGQFSRDSTGTFTLAPGKNFEVTSGGDASFTGVYGLAANSVHTVTGAGSAFNTTGILTIGNGSSFAVQNGGALATGPAQIHVGSAGNGTLTVDGTGSTLSGNSLVVGSNGHTGTATFTNGSSGSLTSSISVGSASGSGTNGTLNIQSGASVTAGGLQIASTSTPMTGSVTVTGSGSVLTVNFGSLSIGFNAGSSANLTVESGASLIANGAVFVHPPNALNIQAGATLRGRGNYSGGGTVDIAGSYLPGTESGFDRTASISFAQNITFQPTTSITLDIGGTTPGTNHDRLNFNGSGTPHVTWNGTLNIVTLVGFTPQNGQVFDLLNFDSARDNGVFSSVNLPALPQGRFWRTEQLYVDGSIRVSSSAATFAEWQASFGTGGYTADDDKDGVANGVEFLLGTNPKVAAAGGGFPLRELRPIDGATRTARVVFFIPIEPSPEARYRLRASSDLLTWTTIASKDGTGPWTGSATVSTAGPMGGFTEITVSETLPLSTARRFHRLEGEAP